MTARVEPACASGAPALAGGFGYTDYLHPNFALIELIAARCESCLA